MSLQLWRTLPDPRPINEASSAEPTFSRALPSRTTSHSPSLARVVRGIIHGTLDAGQTRWLIHDVHRMALAYLRRKAHAGTLHIAQFGLSLPDLALDCIADLFGRDERGRFTQLTAYFEEVPWHRMNDDELRTHLRRLVFSKVNDGIFRRYREVDPALSKIIRNIKIAIRGDASLHLAHQGSSLWLHTQAPRAAAPLFPPELLAAHLTATLREPFTVTDAVATLKALLLTHTEYRGGYPLLLFASLLRAAFTTLQPAPDDDAEATFRQHELDQALAAAVRSLRQTLYPAYVSRRKLSAKLFDAYMEAITDLLSAHYLDADRPELTYYDALRAYVPTLDPATYRRVHRHKFEYITKLVRTNLVDRLQRMME